MLDGTKTGIDAAVAAAQNGQYYYSTGAWKGYHFQTAPFQNVTVEFATQYSANDPSSGDWTSSPPDPPVGYRFVRVTASGQVPVYLAAILTGQSTGTAAASAVAAQVKMTAIDQGLVPFAPLAHCSNSGVPGLPPCASTTNFGFVEGQLYTLRWGANTFQQTFRHNQLQSSELGSWCPGDVAANGGQYPSQLLQVWIYNPELLRNKTGFWSSLQVDGNANVYRQLINGWQGEPIDVSENLPGFETTPPQISAMADPLEDRGNMAYPGNVVYTPIVDPITGEVLGFYCFRVLTSYSPNGNSNWCAEFLGGCVHGSGRDSVIQDGVYEIRLVR